MQHLEQIHDLAGGVWRPRLLAVAEGGVGDQELRRRVQRLNVAVENNPRHGMIGKHVAQQIGLGDVVKFAGIHSLAG